jgi:predicted DNA-binding ribbon-helix-helix protein
MEVQHCRTRGITGGNDNDNPIREVPSMMKSPVSKRSIVIGGHKTSVSLEGLFWSSLKEIARDRSIHMSELVAQIDVARAEQANLSCAIRLFVLAHFSDRAAVVAKQRVAPPPECLVSGQMQSGAMR